MKDSWNMHSSTLFPYLSRDVTFFESIPCYSKALSHDLPLLVPSLIFPKQLFLLSCSSIMTHLFFLRNVFPFLLMYIWLIIRIKLYVMCDLSKHQGPLPFTSLRQREGAREGIKTEIALYVNMHIWLIIFIGYSYEGQLHQRVNG